MNMKGSQKGRIVRRWVRPTEMAQQVEVHSVLAKHPGSVPSIHISL